MYFIAVVNVAVTFREMRDPVAASVLDYWRQTLVDSCLINITPKDSWLTQPTDILLQTIGCGQHLDTSVANSLMHFKLIGIERIVLLSLEVEEKIAKRQMQDTDW